MNKPGDTFGTPWATIQAHIATPTEPHCTFGRHYYVRNELLLAMEPLAVIAALKRLIIHVID